MEPISCNATFWRATVGCSGREGSAAARRGGGGRLGGSEPTASVPPLGYQMHCTLAHCGLGTFNGGRAKRGSGGGLWPTEGRGATARDGGRVKRLKRGEGGASGGVVGGSLLFALAGEGLIELDEIDDGMCV